MLPLPIHRQSTGIIRVFSKGFTREVLCKSSLILGYIFQSNCEKYEAKSSDEGEIEEKNEKFAFCSEIASLKKETT